MGMDQEMLFACILRALFSYERMIKKLIKWVSWQEQYKRLYRILQ